MTNVKYGKQIVATLSQQLTGKYEQSFEYTKITRIIKFAKLIPGVEIRATVSHELEKVIKLTRTPQLVRQYRSSS